MPPEVEIQDGNLSQNDEEEEDYYDEEDEDDELRLDRYAEEQERKLKEREEIERIKESEMEAD